MKISPAKKVRILSKVGGKYRCGYCGRQIYTWMTQSPLLFTVDHITPIAKGGTNKSRNLMPACAECNTAKGSQYIDQYRKLLGGHFKFYFEELKCGRKRKQS